MTVVVAMAEKRRQSSGGGEAEVRKEAGERSSSLVPGGRCGIYCEGWLRPSYFHGEREISRE